jgi:hypothetical protein
VFRAEPVDSRTLQAPETIDALAPPGQPSGSGAEPRSPWRLEQKPVVEAATDGEAAKADGEDLSGDLLKRAEEGRASRILEYFKN